MKKILVPCDFSKPAMHAFEMALDLAQQSQGIVHLLNVIELPLMSDPGFMPVLNFEQRILDDLKVNSESKFQNIISKRRNMGVEVVTCVQFGIVTTGILDYIAENSIDVVFMGSLGASGIHEVFVGSNSEKIVRRSAVPVLIIKDYYKGPIKNIVFPNNLEIDQEDLMVKVKALQKFFKARLHIVRINTPANFQADSISWKQLEDFASAYEIKDYTLNIFNYEEEEEGIRHFCKFIKGDLIALGTHGYKGITHIINGSVAEDVVNHTDKLVWTYTLKHKSVEA